MAEDAPHHLTKLVWQRAGVVVLAVLLADGFYFYRHFGVASCWHRWEQMVLDLVA